jgi:23S rRNA (cytidine2498-2'-O)-methyltransferase
MFVRSLFVGSGPHRLFDPATTRGRPDRVAPLLALVATKRERHDERAFDVLRLETADTNEGKEMSAIARALAPPLADALRAQGALAASERDAARAPNLHVLFADGAHAYVGVSKAPWASAWTMGIPRLRMPRHAPSRSTLKLAEAIVVFLGEREAQLLRSGMRAVDLGAAPGGWTWQLAQRGLTVTAVDNGPLKGAVADDPRVTHLRVDGLNYWPRRPVDWMVCDIAAPPSRVATTVARWLGEGLARQSIFNLKLPMKKRYDEALRCRAMIAEPLARAGIPHTLVLKQLYHDREEITGYCARRDHSKRQESSGTIPRRR